MKKNTLWICLFCTICISLFADCNKGCDQARSTMESTLLGIAIGDAFGVGIEMRDRDWIEQNVDFSKYISVRRGKYAEGYRLGDYSDDTSDSIAVIHALMNASLGVAPFNEENLLEQIRLQYELSKLERNGVPRAGFGSLQDYLEGIKSIDEVRYAQSQRTYPGNAPPMRAIPIGFIPEEQINTYATINADVTHPHPKARAASIIVARAARFLIVEKGAHADLIAYCQSYIKGIDGETWDYLGQVDLLGPTLSEEEYIRLVGPQPIYGFSPPRTGLGVDAMRTAGTMLYICKHSKTAFEALKRAICIGGDVDSLAALVTGLMGGRYGLEDMPAFLFEGLEGREAIRDLAHQYADIISEPSS